MTNLMWPHENVFYLMPYSKHCSANWKHVRGLINEESSFLGHMTIDWLVIISLCLCRNKVRVSSINEMIIINLRPLRRR